MEQLMFHGPPQHHLSKEFSLGTICIQPGMIVPPLPSSPCLFFSHLVVDI